MENKHGDVRPISDDSVSELPSSHVALPTETLTEMGIENQDELSYEDEDEGEIMVEIVGSDVFVDGVITHNDGDLDPGEVGNLDCRVWDDREEYNTRNFPEATAISSEGGENHLLENDSGIHCEETNVLDHEKECLSEEIKDITCESNTLQNDVHDENEGCLKDFLGNEHEETHSKEQEQVMSIDVDQVLDFEDVAGVSLIADGVLEHEVQQTKGSNEPSQLADDVDDPLLNKDMSLEIHSEAGTTCPGSAEEEHGSPQNKELEVSVEETELLDDDDDDYELESFSFIPNEVNGVDSYADIISLDGVDVPEILEGHISESEFVDVEERYFDPSNHQEKEVGEPSFETSKLKSPSYVRMDQSGYFSPPESDGQFVVSDLVWGKVRSHPWWPGQIFDPSDASETAVKHQKRDSYLVAYFGDRTFAWNDASLLKPFRSQFSQIEKHSNSEAFQNAVNSALDEVARRVELGLACSCIPNGSYGKIEYQIVENAGIREESSQRQGVDQSSKAASFEPDELLQYIRDLAPAANLGADRLDIVIAQAHISAFCRFKGYCLPAGIASSGQWLENDAGTEQLGDEIVSEGEKKKSLTDLMEECFPGAANESVAKDVSVYSRNKRKTVDLREDRSDKKVSVYAAKETIQAPKPSFKIGECIRRVASQLTGSTSMSKGESEIDSSLKISEYSGTEYIGVSAVSSSLNEKLSQLQQVAQDPNQSYTFVNKMVNFFSGFKNSVFVNKRARKKKTDEDFEFDDINDSYWTDRIVQNHSEKQLLHTGENGALNLQEVSINGEKTVKSNRRPSSRKRYSTGNYPTASVDVDESVKRRKQESSPAELILIFAERNCVPSEINLNKMFRRFGPLMESETEVDHDSGRAKVIYKRGSDAQVAHSSAEKFNIFGPVLVNYEIGYSPLISMKVLPIALPQFQEDAALMP